MYTISGATLVVVCGGSFWYLLPRGGKTNPLVENTGVGSMVTIVIMTGFTVGLGLLAAGVFG
jgi:hypothetical protein